jgi:hypothetical protein
VRLDPAFVHQPGEHLGRAVGAVGGQPLRIETEAILARSIIVRAAPTSACRMAQLTSTSTMMGRRLPHRLRHRDCTPYIRTKPREAAHDPMERPDREDPIVSEGVRMTGEFWFNVYLDEDTGQQFCGATQFDNLEFPQWVANSAPPHLVCYGAAAITRIFWLMKSPIGRVVSPVSPGDWALGAPQSGAGELNCPSSKRAPSQSCYELR